jgi:hypothetical protein
VVIYLFVLCNKNNSVITGNSPKFSMLMKGEVCMNNNKKYAYCKSTPSVV